MKPIIASLITALIIALLHFRYLNNPRRYPLLLVVFVGLAGFGLWSIWEGMIFIPVALLLFMVNIVGLLLIADVVFRHYSRWQSKRCEHDLKMIDAVFMAMRKERDEVLDAMMKEARDEQP